MAKLDSIRLRGRSGRDYRFGVYLWGHHFKPTSAIYLVMERRLDGTAAQYLPVYVGETIDLSCIFESHPRQECFQLYLANTIAAFEEEDSQNRKAIVSDLVSAIEPPCNQLENIDIPLGVYETSEA